MGATAVFNMGKKTCKAANSTKYKLTANVAFETVYGVRFVNRKL
jgi:hypothetical protein